MSMAQFTDSRAVLSDSQLLADLKRLANDERRATAQLIAALGEVERRKLYLVEGCSSLFTYCTQVLHLSEHAAYGRIEAARIVRRFPVVLDHLSDGSLTLTAICLLGPVLTAENHADLLAAARHKRKHEVQQIVARIRPQADVPPIMRKVPQPKQPDRHSTRLPTAGAATSPAPASSSGWHRALPGPVITLQTPLPSTTRLAVMVPLAPERYKIQFTASRETYDKLQRARALLRHAIPNGDPAAVFDRALDALLTDIERKKFAAATRPRPQRQTTSHSRHIPAAVRREVWRRDGARCAFVGTEGRCAERGFLELHHVVPFAEGGMASVENVQLRCRAHNAYEAEQHFGPLFVRENSPTYSVQTEFCQRHETRAGL